MKRFLLTFSLSLFAFITGNATGITTGSIGVSLTIVNPVNCLYQTSNVVCYDKNGQKNKEYKIEKDSKTNSILVTF